MQIIIVIITLFSIYCLYSAYNPLALKKLGLRNFHRSISYSKYSERIAGNFRLHKFSGDVLEDNYENTIENKITSSLSFLSDCLGNDNQYFNVTLSWKLHRHILNNLVSSAVIYDRSSDSSITLIPETYILCLKWMNSIIEKLQQQDNPVALQSITKMIPKKEGLFPIIRKVSSGDLPIELTVRDLIELKRKIERSLSEMISFLISYRISRRHGWDADILYFTKVVIERSAHQDRHFALLVLLRGVLPPYNQIKSPSSSTSTTATGFRELNVNSPSKSARLCFPFVSYALRCYESRGARQTSKATLTPKDVFQESCRLLANVLLVDSGSGSDRTYGLVGYGEDLLSSLFRWSLDLNAIHFINANSESPGMAGGGGSRGAGGGTSPATTTISTASNSNNIPAEDNSPEELRRNSVIMELKQVLGELKVPSSYAASKGRGDASGSPDSEGEDDLWRSTSSTRDRGSKRSAVSSDDSLLLSFQTHFAQIGRSVALMIALIPDSTAASSSAAPAPTNVPILNLFETTTTSSIDRGIGYLANIKRIMTLATACTILPDSNKVKARLVVSLGLKVNLEQLPSNKNNDDDLWSTSAAKSSRAYDDDSDLWPDKRRGRPVPKQLVAAIDIQREVREGLHLLVADLLLEKSAAAASASVLSEAARREVDEVFHHWRRPHSLFDFLFMHSSSPELQQLTKRFLRALFAITDETVDDIRYRDFGNLAHFSKMPEELVKAWCEGEILPLKSHSSSSSSGRSSELEDDDIDLEGDWGEGEGGQSRGRENKPVLLPGYADPQTLFMLGEDSDSCLSIRPKNKVANRGLLSLVLHGNVRVLGKKDESGALLARAVVRLLLDEATGSPVLYVHDVLNAQSIQEELEVYDQAAELGELLGLPVIYSHPPPEDFYVMGSLETAAATGTGTSTDSTLEEEEEELEEEDEGEARGDGGVIEVSALLDYTTVSPYLWKEGVRHPQTGGYIPDMAPSLVKRNHSEGGEEEERVVLGIRTVGSIEGMPVRGYAQYLPLPVPLQGIFKDDSNEEFQASSSSSSSIAFNYPPILFPKTDSKRQSGDWRNGVLGPPRFRRGVPRLEDTRKNNQAADKDEKQLNSMQFKQMSRQRALREEFDQKVSTKIKNSGVAGKEKLQQQQQSRKHTEENKDTRGDEDLW